MEVLRQGEARQGEAIEREIEGETGAAGGAREREKEREREQRVCVCV